MSSSRRRPRNRRQTRLEAIPNRQRVPVREVGVPVEVEDGSPEGQRAQAVRALMEPGRQRRRAAAELERLDAVLRPLVVSAAASGVPHRRIEELTGVSKATVGRWAKTTGK